ncbi:hypothetical protein [Psychromicrobium sp. YIM B11713]|uniref:hypothetical protein n=1 Tax=Psychromicrobium sp. YIM B11713 TaxID=3145233 RepID=UPI00374F7175
MPEIPPRYSEDLAARILQRTEGLQTNCAEFLQLPYRAGQRTRILLAGTMAFVVISGLLGGIYLIGVPDQRDLRTESRQSVIQDQDSSAMKHDMISCFFRGLHRVLG